MFFFDYLLVKKKTPLFTTSNAPKVKDNYIIFSKYVNKNLTKSYIHMESFTTKIYITQITVFSYNLQLYKGLLASTNLYSEYQNLVLNRIFTFILEKEY